MKFPTEKPAQLARFEHLDQLLRQDLSNSLLLADTADAAIAAGALDRAGQLIEQGIQSLEARPAWQFRLATLRIAQRRLVEAREVLIGLEHETGFHPSITHNLAYIELLNESFADCADMLKRFIDDDAIAGAQAPAIHALWLRAMHHTGALNEAWEWVQRRRTAGTLGVQAAGVASLVAVDLGRVDDAMHLSQEALDAGYVQIESLTARASVALARRDAIAARQLLEAALDLNPHDARTWTSLGFAELLDQKYGASREAFEKALRVVPTHLESWQGLGWSCVLQHELQAAATAFTKALGLDDENAESHGGKAVVHALRGESEAARQHIARAFALDRSNLSARFAQGILAGETAGPDALKVLASGLVLK